VPRGDEVVVFKDFFYSWFAIPSGSSDSEALGTVQREAAPLHAERDCCFGQVFVGGADLQRRSVRGCLLYAFLAALPASQGLCGRGR